MANYTKTTDFAAKDTLPGGDTNKVVRGTEFETEFDAISTAIATKSDTAGPTFTGTVTIPTVDINAGAIDGTTIGASSAAAGTFTNITASGTVNFNGATVSNLGTITTANLDGGTADNIVIGGSTAAAGTFTTLAATSATVGGAAVLTSVAFSNIDAGAITTSGETFADSDTQIPTNAAVKDHVEAVIPTLTVTEASVTAHQAALAIAATQITSLTSSVSELNLLDGVTATTAEINYLDGVTSNIQTQFNSINPSPTFTATASGSIANGKPCIVKADGNVAQVAETPVSQSAGTAALFESAAVRYVAAAYDSNAQKVVIAYTDDGNNSYGTAVVGTVSGTSISFGTPVVFKSESTLHISVAYDVNAQKVVICYNDFTNSQQGTAIVGTVSGTSISFGSSAVFESGTTGDTAVAYDSNAQKVVIAYRDGGDSNHGKAVVGTISSTSISFGSIVTFESASTEDGTIAIAYDSNAQKVVIAYKDGGNSNYGTAIVGTVSSTSISFGTAVVFEAAYSHHIAAAYDASSQKVVIAYQDNANSAQGTAIVGTISDTSISFGTAVVFESGTTTEISATYDATAQKVVIAYRDGGNSNYGTAIAGAVSGTSISFNTATVFEAAATLYIAAVYDSNAQKVVIAYEDDANSDYGTAVVFTTGYSVTNLTLENYVGISNAAYSDSASATIQTIGAVDDAQSSLTPGQLYYVQTDGTLSTTAGTPSVVAGVAVASTKLLISRS